ncbi:MAG: hypothetical protein J6A30_05300 [Ruminococcus sp.]|nr:hypothetical protein [Ruminococcus sp.]
MNRFIRRIKRNLICLKKAQKKSARIAISVMYIAFLFFGLSYFLEDSEEITEILLVIALFVLIVDIFITYCYYIIERSNYRFFAFHKYDDELIGNNFTGFKKKDKIFSTALDELFSKRVKNALDLFISLKDYELSDSEKGIVHFYIARCYQLIGFPSNALSNYETALSFNFNHNLVPLFMSRCCGDMGEIDKAIEIFNETLENKNEYIGIFKTDIGRMYLAENNGREALKWFLDAVEKREDYSNALGGCAIAYTLIHDLESGEKYYKKALLNNISNPNDFTSYYKKIQASVILDGNHSSNNN